MKLTPARLLLALVAAVSLPVSAQNLITVNGKAIPSARADMLIKQATSRGQPETPEMRNQVKDYLVAQELLVQEADKQGFGKTTEAKEQLEMARQQIVIGLLVQDFSKKNAIKEEDIKAEYAKLGVEYNARHILVETEAEAKSIIAKIKAGEKFEDLAKASKDPGSAANGGLLDWMTPNQLVKPFADAMVALKKGQMTETPVKTQFGYHIIRLEDSRPGKPAPLEEVRPQIEQSLKQVKFQAYQDELKKKAKIQ